MKVHLVHGADYEATDNVVFKGLREFSERNLGPLGRVPLAVALADDLDRILGGVVAGAHLNWLFIDQVFVPEEFRGQGLGRKLMSEIEELGIQHGCHSAVLDTMTFQAPGFYEKLGYVEFRRLTEMVPGHDRVFYRKRLV